MAIIDNIYYCTSQEVGARQGNLISFFDGNC